MKRKNIIFICNFYKTEFLHEIAFTLRKKYSVCWITLSQIDENILISKGWSTDVIFRYDLKVNYKKKSEEPILIKFRDILDIDRNINDLYHLKNYYYFFNEIINRDVFSHIIFSELTHLHEIISFRLSKISSIQTLIFGTFRIPSERFCFFSDEYQTKPIKMNSNTVLSFDYKLKKPDYFVNFYNNSYNVSFFTKLKKQLTNFNNTRKRRTEKNNLLTYNSFLSIFLNFSRKFLNKCYYNFFVNKTTFDKLKKSNYFFYPIHVQPESSIDHLGNFYSNQLDIIKSVWKILPDNYFLLVKEHIEFGHRPPYFYREILKCENIKFVYESTNSLDIITNAKAVFSVSGTSALEAALSKVNSFTFSKTFFNNLEFSHNIDLSEMKHCSSFQDLLIRYKGSTKLKINDYMLFVENHSIAATLSDVYSQPDIINPKNVRSISKGLLQIIN